MVERRLCTIFKEFVKLLNRFCGVLQGVSALSVSQANRLRFTTGLICSKERRKAERLPFAARRDVLISFVKICQITSEQ